MKSIDRRSCAGPNATWLVDVATSTPPSSGPAFPTRTAKYLTGPTGGARSMVPERLGAPSESSGALRRSRSAAGSERAASESARIRPVRVGDDEIVAHRFEVGADTGIEGGIEPGGGHDAAEHVVRLAQPPVGELGLEAETLIELSDARLPALDVQQGAEGDHRHPQGHRVPGGETAADGGHLTPSRRTRRHERCAPSFGCDPSPPSSSAD